MAQLHDPQLGPLTTLYLATRKGGPANPGVALVQRHLLERARGWGTL